MKKYFIEVIFKNGQKYDFHTDTDVRKLKPIEINGAKMIVTKEQYGINLIQVKEMKITQH